MSGWIIPIICAVAILITIALLGRTKVKVVWGLLMAMTFFVIIAIVNYLMMFNTYAFSMVMTAVLGVFLGIIFCGSSANDSEDVARVIIGILCVVILLVGLFSPIFVTSRLYGIPNVSTYEDQPNGIDTTHLRQVNYEYARWKADKVIGSLGNRVEIGEMEIIMYNGTLTWLGPLVHRGFWKAREYHVTGGYVLVDAEDPNADAVLVNEYSIDYAYDGEYFGEYMGRIIYRDYSQYHQYWTFEIDESGQPWVIVTLCTPTVTYDGDVVSKILVVSPVNLSIAEYNIGSQPGWIDNAFPEELTEDYCQWWGKYVHGYWNTVLSEDDVKIPTKRATNSEGDDSIKESDVFMIVANDGRTYWFTDFTSPSGSDKSMVGYMLTDTKTGQMSFYNVEGMANGDGAIEVATSKIKNFDGWYATQPMFLIIDGVETWFCPILSENNILQRVSLLRADDVSSTVVMGETLADVLPEYIELINGSSLPGSVTNETLCAINGTITSMYNYVVNGTTEWEIKLDFTVTINDTEYNATLNMTVVVQRTLHQHFTFYAYANSRPYAYEVGDFVLIMFATGSSSYNQDVNIIVEMEHDT